MNQEKNTMTEANNTPILNTQPEVKKPDGDDEKKKKRLRGKLVVESRHGEQTFKKVVRAKQFIPKIIEGIFLGCMSQSKQAIETIQKRIDEGTESHKAVQAAAEIVSYEIRSALDGVDGENMPNSRLQYLRQFLILANEKFKLFNGLDVSDTNVCGALAEELVGFLSGFHHMLVYYTSPATKRKALANYRDNKYDLLLEAPVMPEAMKKEMYEKLTAYKQAALAKSGGDGASSGEGERQAVYTEVV
jgi:flagellin-specific chaperone FliS